MRLCADHPATASLAAHLDPKHTHIYKDKAFGLRIRPPDRNGDATRLVIMGKHATKGLAASSARRCSISQSKMRAVLVIVGDVHGKQPLQVPLV
jgi:hypothetical protein